MVGFNSMAVTLKCSCGSSMHIEGQEYAVQIETGRWMEIHSKCPARVKKVAASAEAYLQNLTEWRPDAKYGRTIEV